jgi:WD40 repeat protein
MLWDVESETCVHEIALNGVIKATGRSPDWMLVLSNGRLATVGSYEVHVWNLQTGECDVRVECSPALAIFHSESITCMAELQDGRLAVGWKQGEIALHNISTGACEAKIDAHKGGVKALAVLPNGRLVSGGEDGMIKLWE